jgi:23S rRNA pseudouridine1911/1915/1917 synthase
MAEQVELEVPADLDGARVDKAVATLLDVSRAVASLVIESGVEIEGVVARASDRVRSGQLIVCDRPGEAIVLTPEPVEFTVLHEDDSLIVVDKPAGVVVHPGSGRSGGTLAAGLLYRYPELAGVGTEGRWGLVHRLDKDTSGALLVARTGEAFTSLVDDLRRRRIERTYRTLVEGRMAASTGTIDAPLARDPSKPTRRAVVHGGKPARTHYQVLEYFEESDATLLEVRLETGRTHQIRAHFAAIGHPVVGDRSYGATRKDLDVPRTFLHASRLELTHPVTGDLLAVDAPLPTDLADALDALA